MITFKNLSEAKETMIQRDGFLLKAGLFAALLDEEDSTFLQNKDKVKAELEKYIDKVAAKLGEDREVFYIDETLGIEFETREAFVEEMMAELDKVQQIKASVIYDDFEKARNSFFTCGY